MTTGTHDEIHDPAGPAEGDSSAQSADKRHGRENPRVTAHPTGDKQAAENAENEPAG